MRHCTERCLLQACAVEEGLNPHTFRERLVVQFLYCRMYPGEHFRRILVLQQQHDSLEALAVFTAPVAVTENSLSFEVPIPECTDIVKENRDTAFRAYNNLSQIVQSLYAVASGGLTGLGFGQSRQKYLYLPEEQNDFIFAIICEELGFIGAALIIILFALLIIRGYWLALHARDRFGSLLIVGITTLLAVQVFLNMAVVLNVIPATGIALPFFSYGGTALLIQLAEIGIILSVSRQIPAPKKG